MQLTRERGTLVQALSSMAVLARRDLMRRFLEGLSTDELQYIAEYLGCRMLDPQIEALHSDRDGLAVDVERFQFSRPGYPAASARTMGGTQVVVRSGADVVHKMIILLEYLSMSELGKRPVAWSEQGCA
ncbi:MAG: hypothetical protein WD733_15090 [Bryobacterales bacterium]